MSVIVYNGLTVVEGATGEAGGTLTNNFKSIADHMVNTTNPHSVTAAQTGALTDIVDDTTPQLGAALDAQGYQINNLAAATNDNDAVRKVDVILQAEKDVAYGVPSLDASGYISGTIQFRHDTAANINLTTPIIGEPVWKTDTKVFAVGDGITGGGVEITGFELIDDLSPQLGGDLDINGYTIHAFYGAAGGTETGSYGGLLIGGAGVGYSATSEANGTTTIGAAYGGNIFNKSPGSFVFGMTYGGDIYNRDPSYFGASIAGGVTFGGSIKNYGAGCIAVGLAGGLGHDILAGGSGSIALGLAGYAAISAYGSGCLAIGYTSFSPNSGIKSSGNGAIAIGAAVPGGYIHADGYGALALGFSYGGKIEAASQGAFAMGTGYGYDITASGYGSFAFGRASTADIEALGAGSIQFGEGTNPVANSLQVGGGPRICAGGEPIGAYLQNGDIWINYNYVYIRSNGSSVKIT